MVGYAVMVTWSHGEDRDAPELGVARTVRPTTFSCSLRPLQKRSFSVE